jgi:hypothetical protein
MDLSPDSSVGIATGYGLDGQGSIPVSGKRFFSPPQLPDRLWAYPASYSMGTGVSFSGGSETVGAWSWQLISYVFMEWCLINYAHGQLYLFLHRICRRNSKLFVSIRKAWHTNFHVHSNEIFYEILMEKPAKNQRKIISFVSPSLAPFLVSSLHIILLFSFPHSSGHISYTFILQIAQFRTHSCMKATTAWERHNIHIAR